MSSDSVDSCLPDAGIRGSPAHRPLARQLVQRPWSPRGMVRWHREGVARGLTQAEEAKGTTDPIPRVPSRTEPGRTPRI